MTELTIAIPTRERPEYLSLLMSSLISQEFTSWELLILPNGDLGQLNHPLVKRMYNMLRAAGHHIQIEHLEDIGRSPAVAYNRAQLECRTLYLLCLDDDMWLPPEYLRFMMESYKQLSDKRSKLILCGVTPWMDPIWEGVGPDIRKHPPPEGTNIVEPVLHDFAVDGGKPNYSIIARQNVAYYTGDKPTFRPSEGIAPANFLMRPDLLAVRGDIAGISTFSDLSWVMQLKMLQGYEVWFDLRCECWHVNAHSGGVRKEANVYDKEGPAYYAQQKKVARMLQIYKEFKNGNQSQIRSNPQEQSVENDSNSRR